MAVIALLLVGYFWHRAAWYGTKATVVAQVRDKHEKTTHTDGYTTTDSKGNTTYHPGYDSTSYVVDTEKETFDAQNQRIYDQCRLGETYKFSVAGWRGDHNRREITKVEASE